MRVRRNGGVEKLLAACVSAVVLASMAACGASRPHIQAPLPTATTLSVRVTTDRAQYGTSRPIGVTVQNASGTAYYATDGHSACTIVQMQQLVRGAWQDIMPCTSRQPPNVLTISAKLSEPFTLAPGNDPHDANAWLPGTYRVTLLVNTKRDSTGQAIQAYSAGFRIQ